MIKKVLILGSCVSRDPFNLKISTNKFKVVEYFARTSLASLSGELVSKKIDLAKINSPFQKKMVERDLSKVFFNIIENQTYDIILFDFIDDRFDIFWFFDGGIVTVSDEFKKSGFDKNSISFNSVEAFSEDFYNLWVSGWVKVFNLFSRQGILDKLIINKVYWAKYDDAGSVFSNASRIDRANAWLDRVYNRLMQDIPTSQFVAYPRDIFIGSSTHVWGRSPFHYTDEVGHFLINKLERF